MKIRGAGASQHREHGKGSRLRRALFEEGTLLVVARGRAAAVVEPWLPRMPVRPAPRSDVPAPARIDVRTVDSVGGTPDRPDHCIENLGLRGWIDDPDHISLVTTDRTIGGSVDLSTATATIGIAAQAYGSAIVRDAFCTLNVAAGLLLGRRGRILLHAGAFVAPGGTVWLLVGDSHSGKSSTCANLIRMGWDYLADDQVVVGPGPDERLQVEGWPRSFNLDTGFTAGTTTGRRSPADPDAFGAGKWQPSGPLGGILLPRVEPDRPTALKALGRTDALQELIRQSPWLLADPGAAPQILVRMLAMVDLPAFRLVLGSDSYRDPDKLVSVLEPVLARLPKPAGVVRFFSTESVHHDHI